MSSGLGDGGQTEEPGPPGVPSGFVPAAEPGFGLGPPPGDISRVVVTVRDDVDCEDPSVMAELSGSGLEVETLSSFLGVISGRASHDAVDALRSLDIVLAVEEEGEPSAWSTPDGPDSPSG